MRVSDMDDSYTFKNIRFGASTAGANRFAKPQPPIANSTLQDGSYGRMRTFHTIFIFYLSGIG